MALTVSNLYFLGDDCKPGIIISDILHDKTKKLFMLGIFGFNQIVDYLKDNQLESIYDIQYLTNGSTQLTNSTVVGAKYGHTSNVTHRKYGFIFNHDFNVQGSAIINYDFIVNSYNNKIQDFRSALASDAPMCFINFTDNVDRLRIDDMIAAIGKKNMYLFIFTNKPFRERTIPNVFIIKFSSDINAWYTFSDRKKQILHNDVYTNFINTLNQNNILHQLPAPAPAPVPLPASIHRPTPTYNTRRELYNKYKKN